MDDETAQDDVGAASRAAGHRKGAQKARTRRLRAELASVFELPGRYLVVADHDPCVEGDSVMPYPVELVEVVVRQGGPSAPRQVTVERRVMCPIERAELTVTTTAGRTRKFTASIRSS